MHGRHDPSNNHAAMWEHGNQVMGFSHETTAHHFRLLADGGAVEVTANDAKDEENVKAIRSHLGHIANAFGEGDFAAPMSVHDQLPPGVTTMKLLQAKIHYHVEDMPAGGRVSILSGDPVAIAAIQDFLLTRSASIGPATARRFPPVRNKGNRRFVPYTGSADARG
jgi:hypothetical protein